MREALRRILWLVPMLVVVTVLAFGALSKSLQERSDTASRGSGQSPGLPLFFNTQPKALADAAWNAARALSEEPLNATAKAELTRLGAAALPHVLPRIDALPPAGRSHVAHALAPLAYRMRIAEPGELDDPGRAVEFWNGYWQDHIADFRPTTVKRVVRRFASRATAQRRRELMQFDTFALAEILSHLDEHVATRNTGAQRRLCAAAAHAAEKPSWTIPKDADAAAAAAVVSRWQAWWSIHRTDYQSPQGFERLLAPVLQTQYALWAQAAARTQFGITKGEQPALALLLTQAPTTLALLGAGLLGGTFVGILLGMLVSASRIRWLRLLETGTSLIWLALPLALLSVTLMPTRSESRPWSAFVLMLLLGSALVARYQRSTMQATLQKDWVRTYRAMGAGNWRLARVTLRASSGAAISTLVPHTSTLLTCAFVVEYAFGMNGVGHQTIQALHNRDVVWLMLVTLATATLVGLVQILSDLLLRSLDPLRSEQEAPDVSIA
ncbi:MAG: hypothetical protein RJA70_4203 [Pseudomonadota bacterium]|jgi:peptide/nickel transport system permease protein